MPKNYKPDYRAPLKVRDFEDGTVKIIDRKGCIIVHDITRPNAVAIVNAVNSQEVVNHAKKR